MKFQILILSISVILIGCGNGSLDESSNVPSEFVRIAENFRSEASIVVSEDDEVWIGKFDNKKLIDATFEAIYNGEIIAYDLLNEPLSIEHVNSNESVSISILFAVVNP